MGKDGSEITALGCESISTTETRIIVGTYTGAVMVFQYDRRTTLQEVLAVESNSSIPISVSFAGTKGRELHIFGLHDGMM